MKKFLSGVALASAVLLVPTVAGAVTVDKTVTTAKMRAEFTSAAAALTKPFNDYDDLYSGTHSVATWQTRARKVLVAERHRLYVMNHGRWTPAVAPLVRTFDAQLTNEITWWQRATRADTYTTTSHQPKLSWQQGFVASHNKAAATAQRIRKAIGLPSS